MYRFHGWSALACRRTQLDASNFRQLPGIQDERILEVGLDYLLCQPPSTERGVTFMFRNQNIVEAKNLPLKNDRRIYTGYRLQLQCPKAWRTFSAVSGPKF